MEWSGEHGIESSSTGECPCGWSESASSQRVVREEYRYHLRSLWLGQLRAEVRVKKAEFKAAKKRLKRASRL